ncbi:MAG: PQQ-binding-like beta-propeller repeat protein [Pirellulaceae bacterium]
MIRSDWLTAWRRVLAGVGLLGCVGIVCAEAQTVPPESVAASALAPARVDELPGEERRLLARAAGQIQSGEFEAAIELLGRVADVQGERLVPLTDGTVAPGFQRYVPAREYCTQQIAKLARIAPEFFTAYRRRIDAAAARWLAEADVAPGEAEVLLRRIVAEAFLSSGGDEALWRLGERALERGDFNGARRHWERISPLLRFPQNDDPHLRLASGQAMWLPLRGLDLTRMADELLAWLGGVETGPGGAYPDSDLPLPAAQARLALVSIHEGNFERAAVEIELLRLAAPDATGQLAGRSGTWVDLLNASLAEAQSARHPATDLDWSTWGGRPSRQFVGESPIAVTSEPAWTVPLQRRASRDETLRPPQLRVAEDEEGILPYFPVVVGERLILQEGPHRGEVVAFELDTGRVVFPVASPDWDRLAAVSHRPTVGVARFSLTAVADRLLLRAGIPLALAPAVRERQAMPARIDALDLAAEGKLIWSVPLAAPLWGEDWTFAGAPVSDGRKAFVTAIRRGPLRLETHVAALDLSDGRVLWRRMVCASEPPFDDSLSLLAQNLLTVEHDVVYCNTNQGAIAALGAEDGHFLWLTSYPRRGNHAPQRDHNDLHFLRDMNPCVLYRGLVLVAPTDCDRLVALDATNGMPVWATRAEVGSDIVHLLGVIANNLVASGECLYWFDPWSGQVLGQYPSAFLAGAGFARPEPRGYGRGVLAGQHVYWPTRDSILVFEADAGQTGAMPVPQDEILLTPWGATGGNLVLARDKLVIAGADRLWVFPSVVPSGNEGEPGQLPKHPSALSSAMDRP